MGILVGMGWIVLGILYVVYKLGEEELGLGKIGGIGCAFAVAASITLFVTIIDFSTDLAAFIVLGIASGLISFVVVKGIKKAKRERLKQEEQFEIHIIRNDLPMPTHAQMERFMDDIRYSEEPSQLQLEYREMLRKAELNIETTPLDANHFRDMQAAWIYYSKNDILSPERQRIFGEQDLASKTFFDPSIDRSNQTKTVWHMDVFRKAVGNLPTKINPRWCDQPKFAKEVFRMIDESIPLTEETLYPLMLESFVKSSDWTLHWMQDEIKAIWLSLLPKMIHILSQTSMSSEETKEWLKIEPFQLACLPAIREKRFIENEELFSILLRIYNDLLDKEFSHQSQKYNFVALWNGLNSVGKAVGKEGSFFDYPKYIIE